MAYLVNQSDSEQRKTPNSYEGGFELVPREGLEPTLPEGNWILNPARSSRQIIYWHHFGNIPTAYLR